MTPRSALAWAIVACSALYVAATLGRHPGWRDVVVALAVVVAVIASRHRPAPVVSTDDSFARIVHPSAWGCTAADWPEESEGIPGRNDR